MKIHYTTVTAFDLSAQVLPGYFLPLVGVRIEMNGRVQDFHLAADTASAPSLRELVTGATSNLAPCDGLSANKPYAAAASSAAVGAADVFGVVPVGAAEPLYCFPTLLFNAGRIGGPQVRLGLLRDDQQCCCCPGSAEGVGLGGAAGSVASGTLDHPSAAAFHAASVWVLCAIRLTSGLGEEGVGSVCIYGRIS